MSNSELLFSFQGRINRARYWITSLAMLALAAVGISLIALTGGGMPAIVIASIAYVGILYVGFAIGAKRLHDRNRSAWWLLLYYVLPSVLGGLAKHVVADQEFSMALNFVSSLISIWALIELGFLKGTEGPNDYGPDPLAGPR